MKCLTIRATLFLIISINQCVFAETNISPVRTVRTRGVLTIVKCIVCDMAYSNLSYKLTHHHKKIMSIASQNDVQNDWLLNFLHFSLILQNAFLTLTKNESALQFSKTLANSSNE